MNKPFHIYGLCIVSGLITVLSGCRKDPPVIPEGKLVPLLADLYVAEAYTLRPSGQFGYAKDSIGSAILEANGVTVQQLDSTLGWYGKNIDNYSELYAKVDRELEKRSRDLARAQGKTESDEEGNIWPYAPNFRLTARDFADGLAFNISMPDAENGRTIEWKIRNSEPITLDMLLGVEYSDGESVYQTANLYGNARTGISIMTDSTRSVQRIFGTLLPQTETLHHPLLIDSISLRLTQGSSTDMYGVSRQKRFRMYGRPKKQNLSKDSVPKDSINDKDFIQKTQ